MAERISRTVAPNQDPKVRATNFDEVCYGFDEQMALREASRCLNCKNPRCVASCPVNISIPEFISRVKEGDFKGAGEVISRDSSLPAICGRVCPQGTQCEGTCILGIKFEPVAIGQLERFVADWNRENNSGAKPAVAEPVAAAEPVAEPAAAAAVPSVDELNKMTVAQLKELAAERGVKLSSSARKAEIIETIQNA